MNRILVNRIQVNNLFGNINYDIDCSENSSIAIITAPNGRGKTTILNLISFVLNPSESTFSAIQTIPFDRFRCILSNGKVIELMQIPNSTKAIKKMKSSRTNTKREELRRLEWRRAELWTGMLFEDTDFVFSIYGSYGKKLRSITFSEFNLDLEKMSTEEFLKWNKVAGELLSRMVLRGGFSHLDSKTFLTFLCIELKQLLAKYSCAIPVNFIKADRIQPVIITSRRMRDRDETPQQSPLIIASKNIGKLIKESTDNYNESVSQAKDKLPQMFLAEEGSKLDCDEFMKGWAAYRTELVQFQEIGLITPTKDFTKGKDISKEYIDKGAFLSTYLSAFKETTAPLRDIYKRLSLFKKILDERNSITGKRVVFNREGVSLFASDQEIKLETLSSGEKHDFIMFYNLIFNISNNGLVLVDEPEISLHIEWQETYLDKLLAICEMNDLQAIVATHSPNIISSHFDLLVDKGESDGEGRSY